MLKATLRAALVVGDDDFEYAVDLAKRTAPGYRTIDPYPGGILQEPPTTSREAGNKSPFWISVIKNNMISACLKRGGDLHVFPYNACPGRNFLSCRPDCLLITNGPGDPNRQRNRCHTVIQDRLGGLPVFGICMGIQIVHLPLAETPTNSSSDTAAPTSRSGFKDGRIFITTQNHGFAVDADSLPEGCGVTYTM